MWTLLRQNIALTPPDLLTPLHTDQQYSGCVCCDCSLTSWSFLHSSVAHRGEEIETSFLPLHLGLDAFLFTEVPLGLLWVSAALSLPLVLAYTQRGLGSGFALSNIGGQWSKLQFSCKFNLAKWLWKCTVSRVVLSNVSICMEIIH